MFKSIGNRFIYCLGVLIPSCCAVGFVIGLVLAACNIIERNTINFVESANLSDDPVTRICLGRQVTLRIVKLEGHMYLISCSEDGGVHTLHAASCPCKKVEK